jgi:hypothetical protein
MSRHTRTEQASRRQHPATRDAVRIGVTAALVCAAGCAGLLGIDEPNVVSDDSGSEAAVSHMDADPDTRVTDTGGSEMRDADAGMRDADARLDTQTDVGPEMDAAENETDATGPNLITNGDFSMGANYWTITSGSGAITTDEGPPPQLCVTVPSGQTVTLSWTPAAGGIMLSPGASYTFSYSAMATPGVMVEAKLGHSSDPYTPDFTGYNMVTTTRTAFPSSPFAAPTADAEETSAGLAFFIPPLGMGTTSANTTVCFENVSLVENY